MGSRDGIIGHQAPDFALQSDSNKIETPALRGKSLVVTFWRANDAQSRIDNVRYQRAVEKSGNSDLAFVSVNLDDDAQLAKSIAKVDGIPAQLIYNVSDAVLGNLVEDYHLQNGCRTYMISADGVVTAVNPDVAELATI